LAAYALRLSEKGQDVFVCAGGQIRFSWRQGLCTLCQIGSITAAFGYESILFRGAFSILSEIRSWRDLRCKWMADLPVMAEWIDYSPHAPPMHFLHRVDLSGTCRNCFREHRIRIRHSQDHPSRASAQRL
jgi:hypothetical protein